MPEGYGIPKSLEGALPWSFAEERLAAARNYWISTTRPDGRPHAMPVWGVWLDGKLYFEGSPETRRGRNLAANPAVAVHLESGDQVVILEGEAHEIVAPERGLAGRLAAAISAKYAASGYTPGPDAWDKGGLYIVQLRKAFAWTKFPQDTTRWRFEP
jgi:nitroimidazol reductase NimA-like FMN-containing flavoprotein (pyridoxamine 5'-phosphate oxidase superfamily)